MPSATPKRLTLPERRRALRLGVVNGVLWYAGNALTTGTLVIYLALDLGASGFALSALLALPALVGLLRLAAPAFIARLGSVKRACLAPTLASYLLTFAIPPLVYAPHGWALAALVALLCLHQSLEYIGSVALWTWLGELVPRRVRGRYFGRRQIWQLAAAIPALAASGAFADAWLKRHSDADPEWRLLGYALPFSAGCLLLLASLALLAAMPSTEISRQPRRFTWRGLALPLTERPFRRLLYFGCWLSFFNGVIQSAQNIYPKRVLHMPVLPLEAMRVGMRVGQMGVSAWAGRFSDRYGNRPTLIAGQLLLGTAPLFFLLATPARPWWLAGAWLMWSFYAALNVCLPNLALKLSQDDDYAPYVATYFAATSLCYAASTVAGGWLFDRLAELQPFAVAGTTLDHYQLLFLASWLTRTAAVVWLFGLVEPGAYRWREILFPAARVRRAQSVA